MNFSAPFRSSFVLRFGRLGWAAALSLSCTAAFAQAPAAASDYTASLPSVQRVESAMQGTDPIDTTARQVAVFEYLQVYIQRIKEARDYRGPYSPGEAKLRTDYAKAQYDLTQSFTKSHSPQEMAKFTQLEGQYSINNALDWIKQLEGTQAADTYKGTEASLAQSYKQHEDQMQQQMKQDNGQSGGGLLGGLMGGGGGNADLKPEQKRCLELGGMLNQCANAMMGLVNLIGNIVTMGAVDNSPQQPPLSGVILVGSYHSRMDLPEVALGGGTATLSKCGTLVDGTRAYTLRKSGSATQVVVDNEPDPIVLTLRADGSLSGPGNIQVKGSIIIGYHNVTTCTREGTPYASCGTTSTPIYGPSMQRCTVSQLAPQPAPPPPPKPTGFAAEAANMLGTGDPVATIYGFRVIGPYASSGGMLLAFDNGLVTLDCGKAHVNAPYTVDNTANGFVIHVQNGGGAFLLGVAPDTTLRGSGSTTVNGKLVSAVQGETVSFTPHSESCNVGTFAPKGKQNTMLASNGPTPVVPAAYSSSPATASPASVTAAAAPNASAGDSAPIAATLAGAGISSAPSGTRAQFRVILSSSFSGTNPLAGQAVFVSRKPMDQILRELGVSVPANATPGQAMKALQTQCHSAQGCSAVIQGMPKYYVTTTKLDASGKATLQATATTGAYYFFAIVPSAGGGSLVWDVPAQLAAGDNSVAFNQANSEPVR